MYAAAYRLQRDLAGTYAIYGCLTTKKGKDPCYPSERITFRQRTDSLYAETPAPILGCTAH